MFYIEEPDTHGHAFGSDSSVVKNLVMKLDNVTRYLEVTVNLHLPFLLFIIYFLGATTKTRII